MSKQNDPIEELFRGAAEKEYPFREADWRRMEAQLDRTMPRPGNYLTGQILVALLIASTPWWPWNVGPGHPENTFPGISTETQSGSFTKPLIDAEKLPTGISGEKALPHQAEGYKEDPLQTESRVSGISTSENIVNNRLKSEKTIADKPEMRKETPLAESDENKWPFIHSRLLNSIPLYPPNSDLPRPDFAPQHTMATAQKPENKTTYHSFRPYLLVGTEWGSTRMNEELRQGWRAGLGLRYLPVPQLSLSVSALYSRLAYTAFGEEYTLPPAASLYQPNLNWTDGQCEMIEFPIELAYHPANWLNVGLGVRSYILLHESYELYLTDTYGQDFKMDYQSDEKQNLWAPHLIFKMGLSVPVMGHSVEIQPFYQIPLKGIGAGSVEWKSAGVSILLMY